MTFLTLALALAATSVIPSPTTPDRAFSVSIPTADLDLATPAGQAALRKRVDKIALQTCAPKRFPATYDRQSLRACRARFTNAASLQLSAPPKRPQR